jgi:5-formyltetrahydrofolate cyclo-ligase
MTKAELRKVYLQKRQELSEAEYMQLNHALCEMFFAQVELSFVRVLHLFIPIEKKREPDTWLIIDRIRREFPHIKLSIPRVDHATGELQHVYFEGLHQLRPNNWGILEPKDGISTRLSDINMVLVPMLTFDKFGDRVGYGKGFYDKFLEQCPAAKSVGLSLFEPVEEIDDVAEHDVPMNFCVTPLQAYRFRK